MRTFMTLRNWHGDLYDTVKQTCGPLWHWETDMRTFMTLRNWHEVLYDIDKQTWGPLWHCKTDMRTFMTQRNRQEDLYGTEKQTWDPIWHWETDMRSHLTVWNSLWVVSVAVCRLMQMSRCVASRTSTLTQCRKLKVSQLAWGCVDLFDAA